MKKYIVIAILFIVFKGYMFTAIVLSTRHTVPGGKILITIPPGRSATQIAELLSEGGIPISPWAFTTATALTGIDKKLASGTYELGPDLSLSELLDTLTKGKGYSIQLGFPEGVSIGDVANRLDSKLGLDESVIRGLTEDPIFADSLVPGETALEGFLYPDTYMFPMNITERKAVKLMVERFDQIFDDSMKAQAGRKGLSIRESVILASIIEREAMVAMERKIISGIFHNRLRIGRPIESCATVRYILDKPTETLTYRDLEVESPYNTYTNTGLPPSPICNPGRASLEAAVKPADVEYLYFVARGDGSHIFSKTLAEHNLAKRKVKTE
jgi:UPF0755 protein